MDTCQSWELDYPSYVKATPCLNKFENWLHFWQRVQQERYR